MLLQRPTCPCFVTNTSRIHQGWSMKTYMSLSLKPCIAQRWFILINLIINVIIDPIRVFVEMQQKSSKRDCHGTRLQNKESIKKNRPHCKINLIILLLIISLQYVPPPTTAARGRRFRSSTAFPGWLEPSFPPGVSVS